MPTTSRSLALLATTVLALAGCTGLPGGRSCRELDTTACRAEPLCKVFECAVCGGHTYSGGCVDRDDDGPWACPGIACLPCAQLDEAACAVSSECHPVYRDPGTCACAAAGCCAQFEVCAEGDRADCTGPAACDAPTPRCEGEYVVSYTGANGCYDGCVKQSDCR